MLRALLALLVIALACWVNFAMVDHGAPLQVETFDVAQQFGHLVPAAVVGADHQPLFQPTLGFLPAFLDMNLDKEGVQLVLTNMQVFMVLSTILVFILLGGVASYVRTGKGDEVQRFVGPSYTGVGLADLLREARGTVTNVSSGMGALNEMGGGYPGYRVSKAALNAITRVLDHELHGVRVNSVCPGWVKTDMGGAGATRELEEGVASITWAALLPEDGPTGGFFRDGQPVDW